MHVLSSAGDLVAPWWRRPGVWVVIALIATGLVLTAGQRVLRHVQGSALREVTETVRTTAWPDSVSDWDSACGYYGLRCGRSELAPDRVAEDVAGTLRAAGIELGEVACGPDAVAVDGGILAERPRVPSDCAAVAQVGGGTLTVVARDTLASVRGAHDTLDLGRTAVVVEWDIVSLDRLLAFERDRFGARFDPAPVTPAEIAALPGQLASVACVSSDVDQCMTFDGEVTGPGEARELVEQWAATLREADFLLTSFACEPGGSGACVLSAERGRGTGDRSVLNVFLIVDSDDPGRANVSVTAG